MDERDPQTYAIIGACLAVHSEKGCEFCEPIYHEWLQIEFEVGGIPYEHEKEFTLEYRGRPLKTR